MGNGIFEQDELESYRPTLFKCALTLTHHWSDAEDLVQRTFERALKADARLIERGRRLSWLRVILKNLFIDDGRRRTVRKRVMAQERNELESAPSPAGHGRQVNLKLLLGKVLREIPEEMAQAILLVVVEGFTYVEVAEMQGVAVGTVKSRVARARKALAEALTGQGAPPDEDNEDD